MNPRNKLIVTLALLVLLGGLGTADYLLSGDEYSAQLTDDSAMNDDDKPMASSASSSDGVMTEGGVAKHKGPDALAVLQEMGFTAAASEDLSLLSQVVSDGTDVNSIAILMNGDRAGSVTWVESPEVKNYFIALKEALLGAFSPQMTDLKDETLQETGKPVRNLLTFFDPAISEERILFARSRERLYEFHIVAGKEESMNQLVEELTSK